MKIQLRLTIYFTLLVIALIVMRSVVNYLAIYDYTQKEFYHRLDQDALTTANRLLQISKIDSSLLKEIDRMQSDLLPDENISIYDSTNKEIYTNNDSVNFKTSKGYFDKIRRKKYIRYSEGPYKIIGIYFTSTHNNVIITAGAINDNGAALLRHYRNILILTLLVFIAITIILGWYFVGKALQPLSAIIRKVETLSPVEHSDRLTPLKQRDEIGKLIETFNNLFNKLEDSFKLQKSFVSNASHEIFNPLTKMKAQLEVSLIHNRDNDSYRQTIQSVLDDLNDLITMVNDLLNFSKLESNSQISNHPIRVDELLFDIRNYILLHNPEYNIFITLTNPPQSDEQFICYGNKQLLFTAIKNIVENACKFSPDKSARLELVIKEMSTSLLITDSGPGIPEESMPFIFEPFYRSRSMESVKGFGIGLTLAQRVLNAHKFSLKVESIVGSGTTFTIQFFN